MLTPAQTLLTVKQMHLTPAQTTLSPNPETFSLNQIKAAGIVLKPTLKLTLPPQNHLPHSLPLIPLPPVIQKWLLVNS